MVLKSCYRTKFNLWWQVSFKSPNPYVECLSPIPCVAIKSPRLFLESWSTKTTLYMYILLHTKTWLLCFAIRPQISYCHSPTQPQLNLNSSWSDYIMTWTTQPPPTHETLCCCCAAGRVTIGDSTSLLTTYRANVNVWKPKFTLV